jgi:hypothetical protein
MELISCLIACIKHLWINHHASKSIDIISFRLSNPLSSLSLQSPIIKFIGLIVEMPTIVVGWIISYINTKFCKPKYP